MSIYSMKPRYPSKSELKAFDEGVQARLKGQAWQTNPYRYLSLEYVAWGNGYNAHC